VDVPRYIRAVKAGKYDEAVAVLREKLPLPTVCADACFAPCEEVCAYKQFGDPIAIRAIKRAAVDHGKDSWKEKKKLVEKTGKKVTIIGAGPTGLTAAYYLVTQGHEVTVFDSFTKPGGMMRYGIPNYRLPEERLDKDIGNIFEWGITFKGDTTIGKDITFDRLKKEFDAVFVASGANGSMQIPLEGAEKKGVLWGWDFLCDVRRGLEFDFNGDVIVVGGGNVAIDVSLTAKRLGAGEVHIVCLENRDEMPAHAWEIQRAEEEGVFIHNSWAPKRILGEETVAGLGLMKCTSVFDDACSFNPAYDEEITHRMAANHVILAVGQAADLEFLGKEKDVKKINGRIHVDAKNLGTGEKGVFAGGDVVSGPDSIISAIAHGRRAAVSIDMYLGGKGNIDEVLAEPEQEVLLSPFQMELKQRNDLGLLKPWQRISGFSQVEIGLDNARIAAESGRCLECDARKFEVVVNTDYCKECGYCLEVCGVNTFGPADGFNVKGYRPMESKTSDHCVGCFKCFFVCPDFAIDVHEVTSSKEGRS
jgi:NADPH-dependent glutamate synthase beta subunit-like oxidoreductase/NAD-dependent dihydropyrimidine dehydrogenase PreA subunit